MLQALNACSRVAFVFCTLKWQTAIAETHAIKSKGACGQNKDHLRPRSDEGCFVDGMKAIQRLLAVSVLHKCTNTSFTTSPSKICVRRLHRLRPKPRWDNNAATLKSFSAPNEATGQKGSGSKLHATVPEVQLLS